MSIYEDMYNVGKTAYEHYKERNVSDGTEIESSNALLQSRLNRFKTTLEQINRVQKYSMLTPFISVNLDGFRINTLDKNCVDYFLSMQVAMNGSGVANEVTMNIAYVPKPNSENINIIGEKLSGITDRWLNCTLQYGYTVNGYSLVSPQYVFMITSYQEEMRQGSLLYTIKGYSSLTEVVEQVFNFHSISRKRDKDPMEAVAYNIKKAVGDIINIDISECVKKVHPTDIGAIKGKTIFQYLDTVLAQFTDEDRDVDVVYWYELVDTTYPSTIIIHRNKPKEVNNRSLTDIYMTFDWMGNQNDYKNNLVLDFRTQYQGEINLAINENSIRDIDAINSEGDIVSGKGLDDVLSGDLASSDYQRIINKWIKTQQWSYVATLNVVGIPCDIPIGAYIKINPLIYGKLHHTAGIYMITKSTTNIDGGGFTTSLELIKIPKEEKQGGIGISKNVKKNLLEPSAEDMLAFATEGSDFINQTMQDVSNWANNVISSQTNRNSSLMTLSGEKDILFKDGKFYRFKDGKLVPIVTDTDDRLTKVYI